MLTARDTAGTDLLVDASLTDLLEVYSEEVLWDALPIFRFYQFAVIREDLMKEPGDRITFIRANDLSGSATLSGELDTIDIEDFSLETQYIEVAEFGRGMAFTERLLRTSALDIMEQATKALGRHYQRFGPDLALRNVALDNGGSAVTVLYGGDATSRATLGSGGSPDPMDTALIDEAVETLQTRNVPKFQVGGDAFYVCICHPHHIASVRADADWVAAHNYAQSRQLFFGEAGRWNDVVFITTTELPNGSISDTADPNYIATLRVAGIGAGSPGLPVYQASLFGDSFYALAVALPVQLRPDALVDFGRQLKIAWYSIYGAGLLNATHGLRLETT